MLGHNYSTRQLVNECQNEHNNKAFIIKKNPEEVGKAGVGKYI